MTDDKRQQRNCGSELISSEGKHFKAEVDDLSSFYMSMMI